MNTRFTLMLPDMADSLAMSEQSLFTHFDDEENDTTPAAEQTVDEPPITPLLWCEDVGNWNGPVIKLLDAAQTEAHYAERIDSTATQEMSRLAKVLKTLRNRGEYRRLATIPADWRNRLDYLEMLFPNFGEVIDYLRGTYALAEYGNLVPKAAPLLLNGPPGVGKTHFASVFADMLGSGFVKVGFETAQSEARLSGSAEFWGNTKAGAVFNTLTQGEYANPVFFIDEIDKARGGDRDPMASLYTLFEPLSAASFADESFPWIELDTSHISWICTANDADLLESPILSRLRRFDIPAPSAKQTRAIAQRMFDDVLDGLPKLPHRIRLAPSAMNVLVTLSPREVRLAVREGIGRAVFDRRKVVWPEDLPVSAVEEEAKRKMGFLP